MNIHIERTSSIAAASTGTLSAPPSMIWAAGSSALARQNSRSSGCSMANDQRILFFPSSKETSYKQLGRIIHTSGTGTKETVTATSELTFASAHCKMGVTQGCRKCISDECNEQKRQYFLQQQCPQRLSWARIGGNALPEMASFEVATTNSLRVSNSVLNVISTSSENWEDHRDLSISSGLRGGGRRASGGDSTASERDASLSSSGSGVDVGREVALQPPARFGHTAVLYKNSQILIFGGKASEEHYFNDVYQYDASARRWRCLQEECIDEATAAVVANEQGSVSPSYASAQSASPSFSLTASPPASARWVEAVLMAAPISDATPTDASSPRYSSGSINNSSIQERSVIQRYAATSRVFAGPVHQGTLAGGTLAVSASSSRDGATRYYNSLLETEVARRRRPAGRVGHAAALYQDSMYILSGEYLGHFFDDMWALDIPSLTWYKECGLPFSPRKGHTMHLLPADFTATRARQDMLVVFGGLVKASRARPRPADPELPTRSQGEPDFACAPTNAVLLYYLAQRRWCQLKTCGEQPSARFYHVSQLITGTALVIVFGGRSTTPAQTSDGTAAATEGAFLNDLHILDVSTGFWRHIRDFTGDIPSPRMCAASVFVNDTFGVFAGGGDTYCEDAFEFSLQSRRWRRVKLNNQPACSRPTVTYTKDRLVFFGGFAPRTGVMSCTMELCLSPLSLRSRGLQWWSRCTFEKHIRSCTKSRALEMEEKAAAAAAAGTMERSGSSWFTGCSGQVMLQCSPSVTARSSPLATPRSWFVNGGVLRPAPLRVPSFDQIGVLSAAAPAWGGGPPATRSPARGALTLSPTLSCWSSSSAVFSPLSGSSKLIPSWQDTASSNSNLAGGGTVYASGGGGTTATFCSLASVTPPVHNLFPSHPVTAINSSRSPSQTGSPATVSTAASTSQAHLWSHMTATVVQNTSAAGTAVYSGSAQAHSRSSGALAAEDANVMVVGVADCTQSRSASSPPTPLSHSAASSVLGSAPSVSHTAGLGRSSLPPPVTATGEQPASACFITNCVRNLSGYVAASVPHLARSFSNQAPPSAHTGGPPLAAAAVNNGRRGGNSAVSGGNWGYPMCMQQRGSPLQGRAVRLDVALFGLSPSPQPTHDPSAGIVACRQPSPFVQRSSSITNGGGSAFTTPQQPHVSTQFTESASSSISSGSTILAAHIPSMYAKYTIQRLEGTSGPYFLQALAARLKRHEAEHTEKRTL
ncbi:Kelch motif/Galactose oxidase, central domain containing protein, putative [Leishmania guyanensis]|uniref:Hypothetical predicted Kelch-domain protein n=1 Tax=Leishmania guyanensis TaxID=5670 RepID=A0A1E1IXM6_LEIGU|nr:hypothetical predicted Kelch-domain protein [Leishmania guyanensis]